LYREVQVIYLKFYIINNPKKILEWSVSKRI